MLRASKLFVNVAAARSAYTTPRRAYNLATPPTFRVSLTEKLIHGLVMTVGMLAVPAYISINIKHYRGPQ